jgi:hypothetical protein
MYSFSKRRLGAGERGESASLWLEACPLTRVIPEAWGSGAGLAFRGRSLLARLHSLRSKSGLWSMNSLLTIEPFVSVRTV